MDTFPTHAHSWLRRLALVPALLLWIASAALAQQQEADPPGRVAALTHQVGSVVFAPAGEDEWVDLPLNRPLTRGDRVWTDAGARAELHMGATTLHLDSEAHLAFYELDDQAAQLSLTQGTVNLRVRDLVERENVEVDTPNLAVRAVVAGDYRVDVDKDAGTTRVIVRSGEVMVFGQGGESVRMNAGQQLVFDGRDLGRVNARFAANDDFDQWAGDLNRREDQSVSARYVPRSVTGYQELDNYGTWSNDATYGAVWYPRVVANDWAPYRDGRWTYIRPWGWTWVDAAPWGFAPFHYGRWTMIGSRWCWVPGHFARRAVYSPALVAFIGGGNGVSFTLSSGPGIGWYPLAPGEAWYPTYRTTHVYITNINRNIHTDRNVHRVHRWHGHDNAVTAVRVEDFNRGRPVREHWTRVQGRDLATARTITQLPRPEREDRGRDRHQRLTSTPPQVTQGVLPSRVFGGRVDARPDARVERRDDTRDQAREQFRPNRGNDARLPNVRDEQRAEEARREHQQRLREQQDQQRQQRAQDEQRQQQQQQQRFVQERMQREQQRAQREQERTQRDGIVRQQQERAQREQDRAMRDQAARQQQEHVQRQQERAQVREQREQHRVQQREERREERRERPRPQQEADDDNNRRGRRNG